MKWKRTDKNFVVGNVGPNTQYRKFAELPELETTRQSQSRLIFRRKMDE
jgi:hypothetical protein